MKKNIQKTSSKTKIIIFSLAGILLLASLAFLGNQSQKSTAPTGNMSANAVRKDMSPKEAMDFIKANPNIQVIDVRTPAEYSLGHIANSKNIDWDNPTEFKTEIEKLDKNLPYILYCRSGNRSNQATNYMLKSGFSTVYNILQGITTNELELIK